MNTCLATSFWLDPPGWLVGSAVCVSMLIVMAPSLVRARRVRRRIAGLRPPLDRAAVGSRPPKPARLAGAASPRGSPGRADWVTHGTGTAGPRTPTAPTRRRLVVLTLSTVVAGLVSPPLAVVVLAGGWLWPRWRATAAARRRHEALARELPEVVDLFLVASASGLNLPLAVGAVGERGPPIFGAALRRAAAEVADGARIGDALDAALSRLGEPARPLAAALLGTARYGTALGPALDRLAVDTRQLRRRQAEETIRRVPVKLLFPLVLLVLPAFVLLTVVPLLAGAFRSLPF